MKLKFRKMIDGELKEHSFDMYCAVDGSVERLTGSDDLPDDMLDPDDVVVTDSSGRVLLVLRGAL